jgi:hypothetical protein
MVWSFGAMAIVPPLRGGGGTAARTVGPKSGGVPDPVARGDVVSGEYSTSDRTGDRSYGRSGRHPPRAAAITILPKTKILRVGCIIDEPPRGDLSAPSSPARVATIREKEFGAS